MNAEHTTVPDLSASKEDIHDRAQEVSIVSQSFL